MQEDSSCLSFIHIPKTGGGAIESASVVATGMKIRDKTGNCSIMIADKRATLGFPELDPMQVFKNQSGRKWGVCDDQIICTSFVANNTLYCDVPEWTAKGYPAEPLEWATHFDAPCSKWHTPPGLDSTLSASYNNCDSFCVVRDPIERLMSEYNFVHPANPTQDWCCSQSCLAEFVNWAVNENSTAADCHFIPQVYYVYQNGDHKKGKQICRHVLRYDKFDEQFPQLMKRYGIDMNLADQGTLDTHPARSCDLELAPALLQLVKQFYSADYDAFGFS